MGNSCKGGKSAVKSYKYDYSDVEYSKLKSSFEGLAENSKKQLSENSLQKHFKENQELGTNFYLWMHSNSGFQSVNFDTFLASMEVILQTQASYNLSQYSNLNFEKYHILFELSNNTHLLGKRQNVIKQEIHNFFCSLIKIFYHVSNDIVSTVSDIAISGIFGEIQSTLSWPEFCSAIRKNFPHLSLIFKHYFIGKMLDAIHLPKSIVMNQQSSLLKPEHFSLLLLSNNKIFSNEFELLYSSLKDGSSFNRLTHAIQGYDGPTFIIFEHVDKGDSSSSIKKNDSFIFGVYSFETWNDHLNYSGDSQEYLFALTPKFKALHTKKGTGRGQNYRYLYSKKSQIHKNKMGLGIGGDPHFENFRLWIDDDIETKSYTLPEDATFETGYIVDPSIRKLNIQTIEVWGLGGKEALSRQEEFRNDDMKVIESMRKHEKRSSVSFTGFDKNSIYTQQEHDKIESAMISNKV